ncbi:MAG: hypothetical protein GC168_14210 [Candidatus Hydrogenedens sp.]|nr:hypothetical protein [Candidatus Hydrogenedens sp.]
MQSQWTLELGAETPCDLAWAAAESGEFGVASNWEPPAVPDDDAGCSNLIFDQAGGYEVTFDAGDAANSMRVLSGLPSFTGGTLTLSGADVSDGLSISNEGQLTLNAGTITASGIGVGVDAPNPSKGDIVPASILVKAGATLSSISSLDVARQSDTVGELALEGGESIATVTALGDAAFGVFGEAHVSSTSNVELSISGNLALGQFAGSATEMVMTGASDPEVQLASLFVGKTLTVASAGQADLLLSGLFLADITAMQVGALAGSDGIVNTNDGTLSVEEDLVVGGGGTGSFVLGGNVAFESENVILGADDGAVGTLLAVGESNQFKARQNVIVGDAGRGVLTLSDGLFLEAASLTVSSNPGSVTQTKDPSRFNADGREQPLDIAIAGEIIVGAAGSGEIETLEEAVVRASDLALGVLPGSTGVVFFLGGVPVDADLNDYDIAITDNISVGVAGLGRLATRDSGLLASRNMSLGIEPGGFGRFSAAGELNLTEVSETLTIGDAGRGELSIESAVVFAGACQLGAESDSQGLVQIQFGGELNITNDSETGEEGEFIPFGALQVGGKGTGVVELFDEDTLLSCSALTIGGENEFAGGTLHIAGGALSDVAAGANVGTSQGPGLVRIANGGAMQVGDTLLIGPNGLFIAGVGSNVASANTLVAGRLRVDLEVNIERPEKADAVPSKGDPGPAVFDGDLAIDAGGSLEVVAGAGNALIVTGAATLDGTLQITLQPGVAFTNDQLLNLIEFQGGVSGTFASVTFLNAPEGFDAEVEFSGGTLQLRIINGGIAIGEGEGGIDGEGQTADIHSADQNSDEGINLSELLRVIQFYNAFGLHCVTIEGETEDGYSPGIDETAEACLPHDSDFAPQDWTIILSELLQLIQLYNADGYDACEATESFCPRLP